MNHIYGIVPVRHEPLTERGAHYLAILHIIGASEITCKTTNVPILTGALTNSDGNCQQYITAHVHLHAHMRLFAKHQHNLSNPCTFADKSKREFACELISKKCKRWSRLVRCGAGSSTAKFLCSAQNKFCVVRHANYAHCCAANLMQRCLMKHDEKVKNLTKTQ